MKLITLDFETFYDDNYSLRKLTTEDYITDPRFEVILVGAKINDGQPTWFSGTKAQVKKWLDTLDIPNNMLNCHQTPFDGLILAFHFDIYAAMYTDTRLLAQAMLKPYVRSVSLDACMRHIDLGILKGDVVHNMKGRTRQSLSSAELKSYAEYCMIDCECEFRLFRYLAPQFPRSELDIIDLTLRMYLQPILQLDANLLAVQLQEVKALKAQSLASLPAGLDKAQLMSNPKFAEILKGYGIDPPMKISPVTKLSTYAFAKSDSGWKELEEEFENDPVLSVILSARIAAKSTLAETRTQRLLDISTRHKWFRVPLLYYAAHPGRYGGSEGINVQNFPRVDKSKMRFAIRAPKGYVVLGADLSQIEARITAWIAKQINLVEAFRSKQDIYSEFATTAFRKETLKKRSKEDDLRRFAGKTCILGLQYGMGAPRLRATLRKDGVKLEPTVCEHLVSVYRTTYSRIPRLWSELDNHLEHMTRNSKIKVGPVVLCKEAIALPNGMAVVYNNLRVVHTDKYEGWVYDFGHETRTLWGGKVLENIVQALAFVLIKEYMLKIHKTLGLKPVMQQHDELDYVVRKEHAEKVALVIAKIMVQPSVWCPDLPIDVEVNYGPTFGDCK